MPSQRPSQKERRTRAYHLGLRAEWIAYIFLQIKGYQILERQFLAHGGEIDLIARTKDTVVFVEVKARPDLVQAQEAITGIKVKRISRAARHWISRNPWCVHYNLRGDAIYFNDWLWPRHQIGAFDLML